MSSIEEIDDEISACRAEQIGVSLSSLLYYCGPVIVMILSPLIFKEKLTFPKISGFIIVLIGIFLVNDKAAISGGSSWGLFCGGMSALMYFFMVTLNKQSKKITGMENSVIQLTVSFLTVAVCGYLEPLSAVVFAALILGEKMLENRINTAFQHSCRLIELNSSPISISVPAVGTDILQDF